MEHVPPRPVTIRAIQPSDSAMEGEFIGNLSLETRHYRFLGGADGVLSNQTHHRLIERCPCPLLLVRSDLRAHLVDGDVRDCLPASNGC